MATNRKQPSKSQMKAAPFKTRSDGESKNRATPGTPMIKASSGKTEPSSVKETAASAAKPAKADLNPKWVSTLPLSTASKPLKSKPHKAEAGALDEWVNAPVEPDSPDFPAPFENPAPAVTRPVFGKSAKGAPTKASAVATQRPPSPAAAVRGGAAGLTPSPKALPASAARTRKRARAGTPAEAEAPPASAEAAAIGSVQALVKAPGRAEPRSDASLPAAASIATATKSSETAKAAPPVKAAQPPAERVTTGATVPYPMPDIEALARNMVSVIEHAGKAFAAYLRPRESGEIKTTVAEEIGEMVRSLGHVAEYYMADPKRALEAQTAYATQFINLWAATLQRFQGGTAKPIAEPERKDKRFSDAAWRDNPFFDFLKQAYVLTSDWAENLVHNADDMEPHARDKARFYLKQVSAAFSPSNFIGTNPELLRATLAESGENLARGLKMLAEDIEAGKGNVRIRQVNASAFQLGVNMANTPGR